jgi:hypothetical protein
MDDIIGVLALAGGSASNPEREFVNGYLFGPGRRPQSPAGENKADSQSIRRGPVAGYLRGTDIVILDIRTFEMTGVRRVRFRHICGCRAHQVKNRLERRRQKVWLNGKNGEELFPAQKFYLQINSPSENCRSAIPATPALLSCHPQLQTPGYRE